MQDRRTPPSNRKISAELLEKGTAQLQKEIKILEGWLEELKETRDSNPASLAARKSYLDMLRSRQELLDTLKNPPRNIQRAEKEE